MGRNRLTKKICRCILALSREMFVKEALKMTGNVTKFGKAVATLNTSGRVAGFKRANAAVAINVAKELQSRGVMLGPNEQNEL